MDNKKKSSCCEGDKLIKGINCDVKNCAYHNGEHQCFAGNIYVGPSEADCSANTACVTFKPKDI